MSKRALATHEVVAGSPAVGWALREGEASVVAEQMRFERDLARKQIRRLEGEIERLDRQLREVEADRAALRSQIADRDRVLSVVFGSRSWRLAQAARKFFRRA